MRDVPTGHETDAVTGPGRYEIRVQGHLAPRWAAWFDGMTLARQDDGTTVIHGAVADQAALHCPPHGAGCRRRGRSRSPAASST
jgi:hypothetical protein